MLVQAPLNKLEIDFFSHKDRTGAQLAKDYYALLRENFAALDPGSEGSISRSEILSFSGNQKLKRFLLENADYLNHLAFTADNLQDILFEKRSSASGSGSVSCADIKTFSYLSRDINRRIFFDDNFQSLRESAGLNAAFLGFIAGLFVAALGLYFVFAGLQLQFSAAENLAACTLLVIGLPLLSSMCGYVAGTRLADKYFASRIEKIDLILSNLEAAN